MAAHSHADMLRKELETNTSLTNSERMEILRLLAKFENKRLQEALLRLATKMPNKLLRGPYNKQPNQPETIVEESTVPLGQQVDKFLEELQKEKSAESTPVAEKE